MSSLHYFFIGKQMGNRAARRDAANKETQNKLGCPRHAMSAQSRLSHRISYFIFCRSLPQPLRIQKLPPSVPQLAQLAVKYTKSQGRSGQERRGMGYRYTSYIPTLGLRPCCHFQLPRPHMQLVFNFIIQRLMSQSPGSLMNRKEEANSVAVPL